MSVFIIIIINVPCSGATTENLPAGVLYQVKASYKYQAEDTDELNFEVGEVISVVQYDDPDEQVYIHTNSISCEPQI